MLNSNENNIDNQNNKSIVDNVSPNNNPKITKSEIFFSLFSVIMPVLIIVLFKYLLSGITGLSEASSYERHINVLHKFLRYFVPLEFLYLLCFITAICKIDKIRRGASINIFISNTIFLALVAFFPIAYLFYAFGFIIILPVLLYCAISWIVSIIALFAKILSKIF